MSWAVGWDGDHGRHRGYGVPAYCDAYAKGCRAEIDRGLGFVCESWPHVGFDDDATEDDFDDLEHPIFVCGEHTCDDVDEANLPPEHPDWLRHVLTDESWQKWREENPERVETYRAALATPSPAQTYNLTPMLRAAGFPGWSEVVSEQRSDGLLPTGANTVPIFEAVLAELRANPEKYRAMNPPNGWGTYEGAVEVFADYIEKVGPHPDATVDSWL